MLSSITDFALLKGKQLWRDFLSLLTVYVAFSDVCETTRTIRSACKTVVRMKYVRKASQTLLSYSIPRPRRIIQLDKKTLLKHIGLHSSWQSSPSG